MIHSAVLLQDGSREYMVGKLVQDGVDQSETEEGVMWIRTVQGMTGQD